MGKLLASGSLHREGILRLGDEGVEEGGRNSGMRMRMGCRRWSIVCRIGLSEAVESEYQG